MTKQIEQLMWQQIDGTITPEDKEELDGYIEKHPDARAQFEELHKLSIALDSVPEVEPPTELRQRIHASIDPDRYAAQPAPSSPSFIHKLIPRQWSFQYVSAVAAGFLLGVIGYQIINSGGGANGQLDNSYFSGTMGKDFPASGLQLELDNVRGSIDFRQEGDYAISQLSIRSEGEVDVFLAYDGHPVQFIALGDASSPIHNISIDEKAISIQNLGSGKYQVVFQPAEDANSPLVVRLVADGDILFEKEILPAQEK